MKKIFILLGHSDTNTFSNSLADAYEKGARGAGNEVRRTNLSDIEFDPILHKGYKEIQELEPGLVKIQEDMQWANHITLVYPNWWNTMPAILKGMFDRMYLPGFAFSFDKETKKLKRLLKGRSARVIVVAGTYGPFITRFKFGDYTNEVEYGILRFAGISPVRMTCFGPAEKVDETQKVKWRKKVEGLGKRGI